MSAAPSDPPLRRVAVGDHRAAYTTEGAGPVVLCVHGLPGAPRDFRWLAGPLSRHHRVLRAALPGFGGTPAAASPPDRDALADHLVRLLDALDVERAALLTHSFGGLVALSMAARHPHRVSHLALLASPGLRPHRGVRRLPAPRLVAAALHRPVLGAALRSVALRLFRAGGFPRVTADEVVRVLDTVGGLTWKDHARLAALVRAPTLLAGCDDDALVEPAVFDALSPALPDGPRLRWPTGGHALVKTRRDEILAALIPFLALAAEGPPAAPAVG